ncbi:YbaY family lipoprotein [Kaistia defluvii]|uniref:YbaY family lipoprotein n=1 Tax=Kaistia defluvii TaxID=410841 RepID=UPI002253D23F|nr:YbaY family lipoprotein [Kaistia defluvii]MCX5518697.1 YbaY family lipoprotein [Kaistia defluvii]
MIKLLPMRLLFVLAILTAPSLALARPLDGSVTYRERIALDPKAAITVTLVDVSHADAPAKVIAKQRIRPRGRQVPIDFRLHYAPNRIKPGHRYQLQARIDRGDDLLFINKEAVPISPLDTKGPVTIRVQPVADGDAPAGAGKPTRTKAAVNPGPSAPLQSTEWLAEDIGGRGVLDIVQSTLTIEGGGKISGSGGCNRYFGTVTVESGKIKVGPLGATQMACVPAQMDQERKFLDALSSTRGYRIEGSKLTLLDANGKPLARLVRNTKT